jgi:hypothetical protein
MSWSNGVVEYWSDEEKAEAVFHYSTTPLLHHSISQHIVPLRLIFEQNLT